MGNIKFGIIGVTSHPEYKIPDCQVIDPVEAVREVLKEIKSEVDYTILLAAVNEEDKMKILNSCDIDILLRGKTYLSKKYLGEKGNILISEVGNRGKYFGIIELNILEKGESFCNLSEKRHILRTITLRLDYYKKLAGGKKFQEYFKNRPATLQMVENMQKKRKELEKEIRNRKGNTVEFNLITLSDDIKPNRKVQNLILKYKRSGTIRKM